MIPTGEVVTMATDYLLAATAFAAAMWLWKTAAGAPGRWWAVAFLATGVAAVLGGTSHGYAPVLDKQTHGLVWRLTYVTVGIANFCILHGASLAVVPRRARPRRPGRPCRPAARRRGGADRARAIPLRPVRLRDHAGRPPRPGRRLWARSQRGAAWVVAGVAASVLGAIIQLGRYGQGRVFNHNDLFHVVQAIGIALYARAGRDLGVPRTL